MRVLFDTNVVLDVLLNRTPYVGTAVPLFAGVERREITGLLGATTVTTIHYLSRKSLGERGARRQVRRLLDLFEVAPVTRPVLEDALVLGFADLEDAVLHEAGRHAGAEGVVTRDADGFRMATLPVYAPDELLAILEARDEPEGERE